jgi:hypothetical protein
MVQGFSVDAGERGKLLIRKSGQEQGRAGARCSFEDRNDLRDGFAAAKDGFIEADALASI